MLPLHVSHGPICSRCHLHFLLSSRRRSPPHTHTDGSCIQQQRHLVNISLQIQRQILLLAVAETRKQPRTNNRSSALFPEDPCALAPFTSSPPALPPLDPSGDTQVWNCKCLLSGSEADVKRSVALRMILLRRGADERISYSRAKHSVTNLSLYLLNQEKW